MSGVSEEAANILLPLLNKTGQVVQLAADTSTSTAALDLSAMTAWNKGHFFTITALTTDVWLAVSQANSDTLDETADGAGVTICFPLLAGQSISGRLPAVDSPSDNPYRYLLHKASGAGRLHVCISSIGPGASDVRELRA